MNKPAPPAPDVAAHVFGSGLTLVQEFADQLASEGVVRGLIGPREVPRLWDRHLLNCGVVAAALATGSVADVGTGAGLPGLVWALARPDIEVTLIEPLLRRTTFLEEMVERFGLEDRVTVLRGRAEHVSGVSYDLVTARAVAPLDRLVRWCLPLAMPGGAVWALKGTSAQAELVTALRTIERYGGVHPQITTHGVGVVSTPTIVVEIGKR